MLRARELEAQGALTNGGTGGELAAPGTSPTGGKGTVLDWVTPLEQYMTSLPAKKKSAQSSLRDPGRQVAIVTTASLPWLTGEPAHSGALCGAYLWCVPLGTGALRTLNLSLPMLQAVPLSHAPAVRRPALNHWHVCSTGQAARAY